MSVCACVICDGMFLQLQARETSQLKLLAAEQQRREEEREGQFRKRVEEYSRLESELKVAILDFRKQQDQLRWVSLPSCSSTRQHPPPLVQGEGRPSRQGLARGCSREGPGGLSCAAGGAQCARDLCRAAGGREGKGQRAGTAGQEAHGTGGWGWREGQG